MPPPVEVEVVQCAGRRPFDRAPGRNHLEERVDDTECGLQIDRNDVRCSIPLTRKGYLLFSIYLGVARYNLYTSRHKGVLSMEVRGAHDPFTGRN